MKVVSYSILTLILFSVVTLPQPKNNSTLNDIRVSGKVLDAATKHTIEYANIVLLSPKDSTVITGGVTDNKGNFNLALSKPGEYIFEARFIGYDTDSREIQIEPGNTNLDLGEILIHPSAINLSDVFVEGQRSPVTYQIDKKVIDPSQLMTVISGNAADVLANVPSIQVDVEGNVSLRGSQNFTVLIDGRPSVLDPQDALQQIAATSIDRIEIITNPSAKYDAEGTAGIINIIMKKNTGQGLNGLVNANAGMYDTYGGNFLVNYQDGYKANLGFDYNQRYYPADLTQNSIYYLDNNTSTIDAIGDLKRGRTSYEGRAGIEFSLGSNDILSFGGRAGKRDGGMTANKNFSQFSTQDPVEINYLGKTDRSRSGNYYELNSNYTHNFTTEGHQLYGELFFSNQNSDEYTITSEFDTGGQFSGRKTTEVGPSTEFRGKLDYTLPFSEDSKFQAGYQGEVERSEDDTKLYDYNPANGEYEIQSQFTNLNKYFDSNHAMYSIYSNKLWELQFQGGIRAEYTYRTIEVPTQNESFNIDRLDYFPSIHTSYKISELSTLMASYSRRINRPRGWALEPFQTWIDANNVRMGNPDLLPEFIDSYEAGIQTGLGEVSVSTEIYYKRTDNKIQFVKTALDENVTLTTFENVGNDYSVGVDFLFNFNPLNFWNVNLMGDLYNYKIEGAISNEAFSNESFDWQTRMNNTFKLWSSTQVQFNLNYKSPSVSAQGRWEGYFSSDLSVRQELIKNILAVTLQVRDVFGTSKREFTSEGINLYNYNNYNVNTPILILNLRYTFNNYKVKQQGPGDDNGTMEGGEDF